MKYRTLEDAKAQGDAPWSDVLLDTKEYTVFRDGFPVTEGHVLFVPKVEDWEHLAKCYKAAYGWGYEWVQKEYCDSFNIGQNVGESAGQTVMYPHVHLIPRRAGDCEDPRGGVRHCVPGKGNYQKLSQGFNETDIDSIGDIVYGDGC